MNDAILDLLVCPITHSKLRREGDFLLSEIGPLKYPIKDNLPILLPESAQLPPPFKSLEEFQASLASRSK